MENSNTPTTSHFFPNGMPNAKKKPITPNIEIDCSLEFLELSHNLSIKKIKEDIKLAIQHQIPILIVGESGSGKELLARYAHQLRVLMYGLNEDDAPFVPVNSASIPEDLAESILFGHERGAFTSARDRQFGQLELAKSGSFFLDDIQTLSLGIQAKLLRCLENRTFRPLGAKTQRRLDCQFILSTNIPLEILIKEGHFRHDLYFRLNVSPIYLPSLRHQKSELCAFIKYFLKRIQGLRKTTASDIAPEAYECMLDHPWNGNFRELENILTNAALHCSSKVIQKKHLPAVLTGELDIFIDQGRWRS